MRIIKEGKLPETIEREITCIKCSTVFAYTRQDITADRDGSYVSCPFCNYLISAKDPSLLNLAESFYNK